MPELPPVAGAVTLAGSPWLFDTGLVEPPQAARPSIATMT